MVCSLTASPQHLPFSEAERLENEISNILKSFKEAIAKTSLAFSSEADQRIDFLMRILESPNLFWLIDELLFLYSLFQYDLNCEKGESPTLVNDLLFKQMKTTFDKLDCKREMLIASSPLKWGQILAIYFTFKECLINRWKKDYPLSIKDLEILVRYCVYNSQDKYQFLSQEEQYLQLCDFLHIEEKTASMETGSKASSSSTMFLPLIALEGTFRQQKLLQEIDNGTHNDTRNDTHGYFQLEANITTLKNFCDAKLREGIFSMTPLQYKAIEDQIDAQCYLLIDLISLHKTLVKRKDVSPDLLEEKLKIGQEIRQVAHTISQTILCKSFKLYEERWLLTFGLGNYHDAIEHIALDPLIVSYLSPTAKFLVEYYLNLQKICATPHYQFASHKLKIQELFNLVNSGHLSEIEKRLSLRICTSLFKIVHGQERMELASLLNAVSEQIEPKSPPTTQFFQKLITCFLANDSPFVDTDIDCEGEGKEILPLLTDLALPLAKLQMSPSQYAFLCKEMLPHFSKLHNLSTDQRACLIANLEEIKGKKELSVQVKEFFNLAIYLVQLAQGKAMQNGPEKTDFQLINKEKFHSFQSLYRTKHPEFYTSLLHLAAPYFPREHNLDFWQKEGDFIVLQCKDDEFEKKLQQHNLFLAFYLTVDETMAKSYKRNKVRMQINTLDACFEHLRECKERYPNSFHLQNETLRFVFLWRKAIDSYVDWRNTFFKQVLDHQITEIYYNEFATFADGHFEKEKWLQGSGIAKYVNGKAQGKSADQIKLDIAKHYLQIGTKFPRFSERFQFLALVRAIELVINPKTFRLLDTSPQFQTIFSSALSYLPYSLYRLSSAPRGSKELNEWIDTLITQNNTLDKPLQLNDALMERGFELAKEFFINKANRGDNLNRNLVEAAAKGVLECGFEEIEKLITLRFYSSLTIKGSKGQAVSLMERGVAANVQSHLDAFIAKEIEKNLSFEKRLDRLLIDLKLFFYTEHLHIVSLKTLASRITSTLSSLFLMMQPKISKAQLVCLTLKSCALNEETDSKALSTMLLEIATDVLLLHTQEAFLFALKLNTSCLLLQEHTNALSAKLRAYIDPDKSQKKLDVQLKLIEQDGILLSTLQDTSQFLTQLIECKRHTFRLIFDENIVKLFQLISQCIALFDRATMRVKQNQDKNPDLSTHCFHFIDQLFEYLSTLSFQIPVSPHLPLRALILEALQKQLAAYSETTPANRMLQGLTHCQKVLTLLVQNSTTLAEPKERINLFEIALSLADFVKATIDAMIKEPITDSAIQTFVSHLILINKCFSERNLEIEPGVGEKVKALIKVLNSEQKNLFLPKFSSYL